MAFVLASNPTGVAIPFEYLLGTDNQAYTIGEALVLSSGRLTKCGATTTPTFICQKTQAAETTAATPLPVIRVTENLIFETAFSASGTSINIGDAVTIDATGLLATATTESGVFYVDSISDTGDKGDAVRGHFVV